MKLTRTIQGAVLCTLLFIAYSQETEQKPSRRRRCRCKKYIDQLNKDIDKRFKVFESKFEQYVAHPKDIVNTAGDIKYDQSGQKLEILSADMNSYKEKLQTECHNLKQLTDSMYTQEKNVDNLNKSFKSLDYVVRNFTAIVEKLEKAVRNSIEMRPQPLRLHPNKHNKTRRIKEHPVALDTYPKG